MKWERKISTSEMYFITMNLFFFIYRDIHIPTNVLYLNLLYLSQQKDVLVENKMEVKLHLFVYMQCSALKTDFRHAFDLFHWLGNKNELHIV